MLEEQNTTSDDAGNIDAPRAEAPARPKRKRRSTDRTTIGVAALLALGAAGLYYMYARTTANLALIDTATANAENVQSLLVGGREGLMTLARDVDHTRKTIDGFSHRDNAILASDKPLERDPFVFKPLVESGANAGGTNQAARDAARAKALDAARKLQLQSIMFGSARRSCLVDGKLYFEGQPLGTFVVSRIAQDAITLQSGEFKFELRLRK